MDSWNYHSAPTTACMSAAYSTEKTGKVSHTCLQCGKRYASVRNLNRHLRRLHGQQVDDNATASTGAAATAASGTSKNGGSGKKRQVRGKPHEDVGGSVHSTAPTYAQLVNSEPFFVNSQGRYQFNTNEDRRHVNCPFCILYRTSLHGLAKHCSVQHKREYQDWRSGLYGGVQLRRVPPSDAKLRPAIERLLAAGLLDPAIPMESVVVEAEAAPAPKSAATVVKKRRSQYGSNLPYMYFREEEAVHVQGGDTACKGTVTRAPRLPPCPPLVDCRGLAGRQDKARPHDAVQRQQPQHQEGGDPILQYMYRTHEAESRAFGSCDSAFVQASTARYRNHHELRSGYESVPPGGSLYNNRSYVQQQQQQQSEIIFPGPSFYDSPMCFDGYANNSNSNNYGPYY